MANVAEAERRIKNASKDGELLLSGLGLTSLTPLLPSLKSIHGIQSLDLSMNRLDELPADLGAVLPSVKRLSVAGNPVPGLRTVLMGLRSLPALTDLWIDLPLETEEDQLIVALPNLEHFNGTSLIEDEPSAHEAADDTPHPPPPHQHVQEGTRRSSDGAAAEGTRATYWTSEDSRGAEGLFAQVTEASTGATHPQEFFDYMGRVVKHVTCLTAADDDPLCQEGEVLKARRLLFEYCAEEMAKAVTRKDAALGLGVAALVQYCSTLMDAYDTHWRRIFRDRDARLTLMKKDMKDAIKQIESLMMQVSDGTAATAPNRAAPPHDDGDDGPALIRHSGRGYRHADPITTTTTGVGAARPYSSSEDGLDEGEEENGEVRNRASTPGLHASLPAAGQRAAVATPGSSRNTPGKDGHDDGDALRYGRQRHRSRSRTNPSTDHRPRADATDMKEEGSHNSGGRNGKVLTLKQLKDTIEDIYTSKTRYDAKCKANGLPRETMEQHMYTYLNQRYGLKEIIQDWATAIARGIQRFAADDNDVAVFGKILRNDIDEEFRYVQRQVRDTVRELVRAQIKARRPLKSDQDINTQLEKKMAGTLTEEEWGDVVRYMYNKQDAAALVALIRKTIYQQTMPSRVRRAGRAATPAFATVTQIPYKDLVHLLLDFQLEGHERFLAHYVAVFRRYDRDRNGIVNSEEFKAIVRAIDEGKSEDEVEAMANLVDPFGSQLITFSETVTFLSDELVQMSREQ